MSYNPQSKMGSMTVYAAGGGGVVPGGEGVDGGIEDVAAASTSKAVTFGATFAAITSIQGKLLSPTGATTIDARVDYSTLTTSGVTFRFSSIPASGWKLSWTVTGT